MDNSNQFRDNNYNEGQGSLVMRKRIILIGLLPILFAAFWWLSTHAFVEIVPDANSPTDYTLTGLPAKKDLNISSDATVKKLMRKGQYQVAARRGETSYIAIIKVGGFLSKTTVQPALVPEKARKFIGDGPRPCMYYTGRVLASESCEDLVGELGIHVPATLQQPTFVQKKPVAKDGTIEGVFSANQALNLVLRSSSGDNHYSYKVAADFGLSSPTVVPGLDKDRSYLLQSYKNGFVAYDTGLSQIFYYPSLNTTPSQINVSKPKNDKLRPYSLKAQNDALLIGYSDSPEDSVETSEHEHEITSPSSKANVAIVVLVDGQSRQYDFKKRFVSFGLCGTDKLCVLDTNKQFAAYDISGNKSKLLFTVGDIESVQLSKDRKVLIGNQEGIVGLDVDKQTGSIEYSFGDNELCGLRVQEQGYVVCLRQSTDKTVALFIDPSKENTDSIDKKIDELARMTEVDDLSIYDNLIFISPALGEAQYQASINAFGYDPARIKSVNTLINQAVDRLGIDRKIYRITNNYD